MMRGSDELQELVIRGSAFVSSRWSTISLDGGDPITVTRVETVRHASGLFRTVVRFEQFTEGCDIGIEHEVTVCLDGRPSVFGRGCVIRTLATDRGDGHVTSWSDIEIMTGGAE